MLTPEERARAADMRIYFEDIRAAGFGLCSVTQDWFRRHGMSFRDCHPKRGGIPALEFADKGDALAEKIVRRKLDG